MTAFITALRAIRAEIARNRDPRAMLRVVDDIAAEVLKRADEIEATVGKAASTVERGERGRRDREGRPR